AMVGAFVGWKNALLTIFVGAIIGTGFYLLLMIWSIRKWRRYELPFGVFLAIASGVTFVFGDTMISWYLDFLKSRSPMSDPFSGLFDFGDVLERVGIDITTLA